MAKDTAPSVRPRTRLYLITPPIIALDSFAPQLDAALAAGDVASVQLRLKPHDGDTLAQAVKTLMPIAHKYDVAFILNDDPQQAAKLGCDGVHIGQDDMAYEQAREIMGDDKIIGVTCHNSKHLSMVASEAGADYVAFGAFYDTTTKQAKTTATADLLSWWQELMEPPCVAIGGITPENAAALAIAGADFIAASASIWGHKNSPAEAVAAFNALFDDLFSHLSDA